MDFFHGKMEVSNAFFKDSFGCSSQKQVEYNGQRFDELENIWTPMVDIGRRCSKTSCLATSPRKQQRSKVKRLLSQQFQMFPMGFMAKSPQAQLEVRQPTVQRVSVPQDDDLDRPRT